MEIFKRNITVKITLFVLIVVLASCSEEQEPTQQITQVSTIDALLQGVFDGETTLSELSVMGDFGIGTFNSLDGEMALIDGSFYQVKADGKIYKPNVQTTFTPFATVTFFNPEFKTSLPAVNYEGLKMAIDSIKLSANLFYAIKINGTFSYVKTRSVPAQERPYPTLTEVTANQPEFETTSVSGTLAGFYCPPFVTGINVPGYHLHFISDDEKFGGHVQEFEMKEGTLLLDQINDFRLLLPEGGDFLNTNLNDDLSDDLDDVEG